ncbi:MAG: zinc-binding alcohol dehydrogenase family protein, partial [Candidatus Nanopelagicales bacterium]|nr:zinc-binding alcohol dehydrogenase family protein [Candidatus Nanopelagicales bacterium]
VLIEVAACGVCRTVLQIATGDLPPRKLPIVPGHQVVGRVIEVGADVDRAQVGRTVGLVWLAETCGECRYCLGGRENLCLAARFTGWDVDGGYATQVVARADFAFDLTDLLTPKVGPHRHPTDVAPLLCGGVIGYRSLRVAGVTPESAGLKLGLFGFGASARLAQQVAHHWGVETYVVTRSPREVEAALASGAVWAGTYDRRPPTSLDAAVTFAPVGTVVVAALKSLDRGGCVAINAIHLDDLPPIDYNDLWWERQIRSVANVTRTDVVEFLSIVAKAGIQTEYEELPLSAANDALARLTVGDVRGSFVLNCGS